MPIKIGVAGMKGSFSEEAASYYCNKENITDYELVYLTSVNNVLESLDKGESDLGVFPIENSNGGIVYEAVDAMSKHVFNIQKLFEIDVQHCLHVLPGKKSSDITQIVSHPQALKQCRMYLKSKWGNVELKEYSDTASSAKDISEGKLPETSAAIAPRICSELYGLEILEESIQDLKFNFTTFIAANK